MRERETLNPALANRRRPIQIGGGGGRKCLLEGGLLPKTQLLDTNNEAPIAEYWFQNSDNRAVLEDSHFHPSSQGRRGVLYDSFLFGRFFFWEMRHLGQVSRGGREG